MPKRKNGHSASGDSPTMTVTQKSPKMPDIDYQKLAEEILKQQVPQMPHSQRCQLRVKHHKTTM